jgi:hypothetical protein
MIYDVVHASIWSKTFKSESFTTEGNKKSHRLGDFSSILGTTTSQNDCHTALFQVLRWVR